MDFSEKGLRSIVAIVLVGAGSKEYYDVTDCLAVA